MSDLISSSDKQAYEDVFDDLHDTFGRDIKVFQAKKKIFVSTNSTYNALYSRIKNQKTSEKIVEEFTIKARISYMNGRQNETASNDITGIDVNKDSVRIKVNQEGYNLISSCKDIEVDGVLYDLISDESKIGMFSPKYYQLFLRRKG